MTSKSNPQWDADKNLGKNAEALKLALVTTARLDAESGVVLCPSCGKQAPLGKKFKLFPDGGWKHFSADGCFGDAHSVLTEAGYSFPDAVRYLAGKKTSAKIERPESMPDLQVVKFEATYDPEILNGVLVYGRKTGGVEAAAEFYSQFHISPEAVAESGAVMIKDANHFTKAIVDRFGVERLLSAGLFTDTKRGPRPMMGESFPIVEPHIHPATGVPTYMQFRASNEQAARHALHKAGKRPYAGSEKFLSLRGTPKSAQIGMGLPRLATIDPGSTVYLVEGFKDLLAARTMGVEAFAVPGVDFRPGSETLKILSRHNIVVTLDGDAAGSAHRDALASFLEGKGVEASTYAISGNYDVADKLILKHAEAGCTCKACSAITA